MSFAILQGAGSAVRRLGGADAMTVASVNRSVRYACRRCDVFGACADVEETRCWVCGTPEVELR